MNMSMGVFIVTHCQGEVGDGNSAPQNTVLPSHDYEGLSPNVGDELTGDDGAWIGADSYARQWKRSGVAISGATNGTYTTVDADFGHTLTYAVTATGAGGGVTAVSAATAAVAFADAFARSDGDLGNGWTYSSGKWTISGGAALGTPGNAGELTSNPGMEAPYTSGIADGFSADGAGTLTEETSIVHGGTSSQKIVAGGTNQGVRLVSLANFSVGRLLHVSGWFYVLTSGTGRIFRLTNSVEARAFDTTAVNAWNYVHGALFIDTTDTISVSWRRTGAGTLYVDDVSVAALTMADLYALREGAADISVRTTVTLGSRELAGVIVRADSLTNPQTGIVCFHNGTQVIVATLTGGLLTRVGSAVAATYSAGAALRVDAEGTAINVYYNDVLVRTETISSYQTQTKYGLFATDPTCTFGYLEAAPPGF